MSISTQLAADHAHLLHPLHHPSTMRAPKIWVAGHGAMIMDGDGREYIDGLAGLWNVNIGHGRRELADAAHKQMCTLAYHSRYAGSTNWPAIALAEQLSTTDLSIHQYVLLHQRRRRSHRELDQDGALLLEGESASPKRSRSSRGAAPITGSRWRR